MQKIVPMPMSKKKPLQMQFVEGWMATRPYTLASSYDTDYLMLANGVLHVLLKHDYYFKSFGLEKSDLVDLAITLVAYFEDFINEVGFWNAFVTCNHEQFGFHLPFYPISDDYDPDYINPEDLSFLIWHWLMVQFHGRKMFSPNADPVMALGKELYEVLEEVIESMPATDAYDDFLTVEDHDSFFKIRNIMQWITDRSYLFGRLGFKPDVDAIVREDLKGVESKFYSEYGSLAEFDSRIEQLFKARCKLGGLRASELTSRVLKCSPALRAKVQGIQPRMAGKFVYMGQDQQNYFFQHHPTGRKVNVSNASVDVQAEPGDVWFFSLINWGDEFWSQGISTEGLSLDDLPIGKYGKTIPPLLMKPSEHQSWVDALRLHERKFLEVIGAPLRVFPTIKEATAAHKRVFEAVSEEISGKPADNLPSIPSDGFDDNQPTAMFYVPGDGVFFCSDTPKLIDHLLDEKTRKHHPNEILNTLFRFVHPFAADYILHHYPTEGLAWHGIDIDVVKDAKFLSSYFFSELAGPPLPSIELVNRTL